MEQEAYRELCRATSLALGINDTESLFDTGQLEIDGIEFGIFFEPSIAPDRVLCYIDLGKIQDRERESIFSRLLSLNVISGTKTAGVYGLDRDGEHAFFIQHFMHPEFLTGEQFSLILRSYAFHARHLQTTVLDPDYKESTEEALRGSLMSDLMQSV